MNFFKQENLDACMKGDKKFVESLSSNLKPDLTYDFDKIELGDKNFEDKRWLLRSMSRMQCGLEVLIEQEIKSASKKIKEKYEQQTKFYEEQVKRLECEIFLSNYNKKKIKSECLSNEQRKKWYEGFMLKPSEEPSTASELPQSDPSPTSSDP